MEDLWAADPNKLACLIVHEKLLDEDILINMTKKLEFKLNLIFSPGFPFIFFLLFENKFIGFSTGLCVHKQKKQYPVVLDVIK